MGMPEKSLEQGKHFTITVDENKKLVRVKRTKTPYASIAELKQTNELRRRLLRDYDGLRYCLLLDARDGPLRNDPEFEETARESRTEMIATFHRTAIVVKTAVGMLQLQRLNRTDNSPNVRVFHDDEVAALAFLEDSQNRA